MKETRVQSLSGEDPLEEGMATHSRIVAWRIPRTQESGGLQSMGFSRSEYWSGLPYPPPGDLPDPGTKLGSPTLQAYSLPPEPTGKLKGCKAEGKESGEKTQLTLMFKIICRR